MEMKFWDVQAEEEPENETDKTEREMWDQERMVSLKSRDEQNSITRSVQGANAVRRSS